MRKFFVVGLLAFGLSASAAACGGSVCDDLADAHKSCWEKVDCTAKATDVEKTACEGSKKAAIDPPKVEGEEVKCEGAAATLAEACKDKLDPADDCACSL